MLQIRRATERGHFQNDWLNSYHSFSFGEYKDPQHMGWSVLRVINEDRVMPSTGFPRHPHDNMEIISYVLAGELAHQDSIGNGSKISAGDVQLMSAGAGITHAEFNPSHEQANHFLQIWLLPNERDISPHYVEQHFSPEQKQGRWCLIISPDGREHSIRAHTEACLYSSLLDEKSSLSYQLAAERVAYLHIASGTVHINDGTIDILLTAGDAAYVTAASKLTLSGAVAETAEILLFDLPA